MEVQAILFDTRSIQRYIFSGKELKTNIGASYLVDQLFSKTLAEDVLQKELGILENPAAWRSANSISMEKDASLQCEIAYIGGGNALVLLNPAQDAKRVVRAFTRRVLLDMPGLRTGAAIGRLKLGEGAEAFQASLNALYAKLKQNQNLTCPQVNIPYTGLTLFCDRSAETANVETVVEGKRRFVSAAFRAKHRAAQDANRHLGERFFDILGDAFQFPSEIEKLGQIETEDYIAAVHIDGNNMGLRFSECKTLEERKQKSQEIAALVQSAFRSLLQHIADSYEIYQTLKDERGKRLFQLKDGFLPIRPLIIGGDDVTFVCAARVAVEYAKRFIEHMRAGGVDCCAGIAMIPTAYPFFRAYQLAEQLCGAAKARARALGKARTEQSGSKTAYVDSSWLDFAIAHGEIAPQLTQMRQCDYSGVQGNMHFGPYKIGDPSYHFAIEKLLQGAQAFRSWPRSKVKEMRFVLAKGSHDIAVFLEKLRQDGRAVPHIEQFDVYETALWHGVKGQEKKTPYVDMIEMMDFLLPQGEVVKDEI